MLENILHIRPEEIEAKSFEMITEILGERQFPPLHEPIIKRAIHTSADFDYADMLHISPTAVQSAMEALRQGCDVFTDTTMAKAGINKRVLAKFGGEVQCFIDSAEIGAEAKQMGVTRSALCVDRACQNPKVGIFAVGNAPTALIRLYENIRQGVVRPACVIGVPVGFVNVVESKELFLHLGVPCILSLGRKGGSNIAAAIVNAILYQLSGNERS